MIALKNTLKACEAIWSADGEGQRWFCCCLLSVNDSDFIFTSLTLIIFFYLFISLCPSKVDNVLLLKKLTSRIHDFYGEQKKMWMCL